MFDFGMYSFLIYAGLLALQYFLSTRKSPYWGAIIPVLFVTHLSWLYSTAEIDSFTAYIIILVIGLIFLTEKWSQGRKNIQKNN